MKKVIAKFGNIRGFTLIELLLAAVISIIVIGAAFSAYIVQHKQLLVQEQISDMQQALRGCMDELTTKIRLAGYNLPQGLIPLVAHNTDPDSILIIYDTAVLENVSINHSMPQPSAELRCDGDLSGITDNDWLYIYDPITQTGEFFLCTQVQYAAGHIQHNTMPLSRTYDVGARVMKINVLKYFVDSSTDTLHPKLMVSVMNQTPQVFAEDITDLQFQYILSSGAIVDIPPLATMVREVIISITARTARSDDEFAVDYRQRNLTTRVKVRNLGLD